MSDTGNATLPSYYTGVIMSDPTKPDLSLIPIKCLEAIARVLAKGLKNGRQRDDWKTLDHKVFFAAMLRHAGEHQYGNLMDESGESHAACIATNALLHLYLCDYYGAQNDHQSKDQDGQRYPDGFRSEPKPSRISTEADTEIIYRTKGRYEYPV